MKAQTIIEQAVKACYDAYAEYARKVDGMPVQAQFPKVSWVRGSLKNAETGWLIDGHLFNASADAVVSYWNRQTKRWTEKTRRKLEQAGEALDAAYVDEDGGQHGSAD